MSTTDLRRWFSPLPLSLAVLAGCVSQQVEPIGARGPDLRNYTAEQLRAEAAELLDAREVGEREQRILMGKLDEFLKDRGNLLDDPGITGIAVYHSAGGGFVFKGSGGDGIASFCGGDQKVPFAISGYEVGAAIGGSAHYGIALAIDLRDQRRFRGHYKSSGFDATAGNAEAGGSVATYGGENGHRLRYFATGFGMSAEATFGRFTIQVPPPAKDQ
ncbi:MAG: hypothetical protein KAI24_20495 [Planctomycetes bacterium]|nr:hypothetical protein [Planctomycetota bacterium]